MKPQACFAVLLFLICSFVVQPEKLRCHKTLTPEQLTEDFNILITTLQEAHPDLYRVNTKEMVDAEIATIRAELKTEKTYLEFLRLIAPLFTTIGDINLQWSHSPEFLSYRNQNIQMFPVLFHIDSGKFISSSYGLNVPQYSEILSINGVSTAEYLSLNRVLLPIDGRITTVQDRWLANYFPQHHSNFWEQPDSFRVEYRYQQETKTVWVKPPTDNEIVESIVPSRPLQISGDIATLSWPWYLSSTRACEQHIKDLETQFLQIKQAGCTRLIIDVSGWRTRDDEAMIYGKSLFSYLVNKPQSYASDFKASDTSKFTFRKHILYMRNPSKMNMDKVQPAVNAFEGEVYILADAWTNHVRGFFCAAMQNRPKTFFAGEECGQSTYGTNCCNLLLVLPNSGIYVSAPTAQYVLDKKSYHNVRGPAVTHPVKMHYPDPVRELRHILTR